MAEKNYEKETVYAGQEHDAASVRGTKPQSYPLYPGFGDKAKEAFLPSATAFELAAVRKRRKAALGIKDDE